MRFVPVVLLVAVSACNFVPVRGEPKPSAPAHVAPAEDWQSVRTIAVLPPDNQTVEMNLEYITWYRAVVMTLLQARGWATVPSARINRALNGWGFMMAGEVGQFTAEELAQKFGCDAILSWAIEEAQGGNVRLNFALHRKDARLLWATGERPLTLQFNLYDPTRMRESHRMMSLALSQALEDFPAKQ